MTAKEYLSQVQYLKRMIECRRKELTYWEDIATSISGSNFEPHYNATRRTSAQYESAIEKIDEIQRDIDSAVIKLVDLCNKINKAIDELDSIQEQLMLRYRYLEGKTSFDVREIMNMSDSTVYRIHASALRNFKIPE